MQVHQETNIYLRGELLGLFARTAAPIVAIMVVNGLFVIVDAYFLGAYVGADALSAVTLIFPGLMAFIALQALVSNGMASLLARKLGAGDRIGGYQTFISAHLLALAIAALLCVLFWMFGRGVIELAAGGPSKVAEYAWRFMAVNVTCAPVAFFLAIQIDALRCEGGIGFMALVTIASSMLNILANWVLIGSFQLGVAGSALGTVLSQTLCLALVLGYRWSKGQRQAMAFGVVGREWRAILALGAPMSLGFIGVSLGSAAVIYNLSVWQTAHYIETVAAYGVTTRLLTFAYLPLMGVSMAFQTICGNNFGAGLSDRVARSLQIALIAAVVYCGTLEVVMLALAGPIAMFFVDSPLVISEVRRILPWTTAAYFLFGQIVVLGGYFQAIGDAPRAAVFSLARPYLLTIPLTFLLPLAFGEAGIWMVAVVAEAGMLAIAATVLWTGARRYGWRYGLLRG